MIKYFRVFTIILLLGLATGCNLFRMQTRPIPTKDMSPAPALLAYFPQKAGTTWSYEGYAEYASRMNLNSVVKKADPKKIYHYISGAVEDVSSGESSRNFRFKLRYTFTSNSVFENIQEADTPFPHTLKNVELLRLPLKKGAKWTQAHRIKGQKRLLEALILDIRTEKAIRSEIIRVRYRIPMAGMPNGIYEEIREFAKGMGVYRFEKTFLGSNPANRFNYSLRTLKTPKKSSAS